MGDVTSPENVEIPELPLKPRPGGPLADRPIQDWYGQWYNNFGETKISEEQAKQEEEKIAEIRRKIKEASNPLTDPDTVDRQPGNLDKNAIGEGRDQDGELSPEGVPGLDVPRLKGIYERCVAIYEGENPNGLLDINVVLDENDRTEVRKHISMARSAHAGFVDGNPDWIRFVGLREEMRSVYGTFGENARIIEDNSVQVPTKQQAENNAFVIRVPTSIYRLAIWDSRISSLDGQFNHYDKGNAKGQMASYLGNSIREVYGFVKTVQSTQ